MPTVNYTKDQVSTMREQYEGAKDEQGRSAVVDKIAAKFQKSRRSIVAKMSREGFYIAKKVISKVTGEKPQKKEALAVTLREVSGLAMVSAEKMNKTDLQDLIRHFNSVNEAEAEPVEATEES